MLLSLLLPALAAACGKDGASGSTQTGTGPTASAGGATTGASPAAAPLPIAPVGVQRAFPALSFARMTGMYPLPDNSNRLVVLEQRGLISVFENRQDVRAAAVFLDITSRVSNAGNEEGLLGLAFAPDFERTGNVYVYYSAAAGQRRTVLSRFTATADRSRADPASETVLLEVPQPFPNHKGGQIAFGPDGYLYMGLGDGGSGNDPGNRAQNLNELLGKILRIDVSGASQGLPYRIPADNPFVGRQGARGEIWTYGMRNPWRFSFDSATGDLWAGDVGQNNREEIDVIRKGQNYGWPQVEGTQCNAARASNCDRTGTVPPVIDYATASPNCSVTGGFVYRKGDLPQVQGAYVYGDYCSGKIWALRYDGNRVTEQAEIVDNAFAISSFAMDAGGTLYALAHSDSPSGIYRISAP